jgi:DNA uptake protein ComE-like DNA-binding protein
LSSREERSGERPSRSASGTGVGIDLNTASAEDLEHVFQIDGERARYLVQARTRLGGFTSWNQIKEQVPSFDDGMIENLKKAGARLGR